MPAVAVPSAVAQLTLTSRALACESVTVNVSVPGSSDDASLIESFELLSSFVIVPVAVLTTAPVVGFSSSSLNDSSSSSSVSPLTLIVIRHRRAARAARREVELSRRRPR